MIRVDELVTPGAPEWWGLLAACLFGRACDLGSTYAGTPRLVLEGNPIAKRLGWRWGIPLNALLCLVVASWPMISISLTTSSLLVAARNLQSVWLMRALGELEYRRWMSDRFAESHAGTVLACFLGEAGLTALVGLALVVFSQWELIPFAIGFGMLAYGAMVAFFTSLALWRHRS